MMNQRRASSVVKLPVTRRRMTHFLRASDSFFLGSGIAPENLRISPCGMRREVLLWPSWPELAQELASFEKLLVVFPHPSVILGTAAPGAKIVTQFSEILTGVLGRKPLLTLQGLSLVASEVLSPNGRRLFFSVKDLRGTVVAKFCLMPGCSVRHFQQVVQICQGVGGSGVHNYDPHPSISIGHRSHFQEEVIELECSLASCLRFWKGSGIRLRIGVPVYPAAFLASLTIKHISVDDGWIYAGDEDTGLHVLDDACGRPCVRSGSLIFGSLDVPMRGLPAPLQIQAEGLS